MSLTRLLDIDPHTNSHTLFHTDTNGEKMALEEVQDVTDLVEKSKLLYNCYDERTPFKGDGLHHVAHIPDVMWAEMCRTGANLDKRFIRDWVNNPDNAAFRTRPGRI